MHELENTKDFIPISTLRQILSDPSVFFGFINYHNHQGWFPYPIEDYIRALNQYVQTHIKSTETFTQTEIERINFINLYFKTGYQQYDLDEEQKQLQRELQEKVYAEIPSHFSGIALAYAIYYNLNEKMDIFNENGEVNSNTVWANTYASFLQQKGFHARVNVQEKQKYVTILCDGALIIANAMNVQCDKSFLKMNDMIRTHLGMSSVGFTSSTNDIIEIIKLAHKQLLEYKEKFDVDIESSNDMQKDSFQNSTLDNILSYVHKIAVEHHFSPLDMAHFTQNILYSNLPMNETQNSKMIYGKLIDKDIEQFVTLVGDYHNPDTFCYILVGKLPPKRIPSKYLQQLHEHHLFLTLKESDLTKKGNKELVYKRN